MTSDTSSFVFKKLSRFLILNSDNLGRVFYGEIENITRKKKDTKDRNLQILAIKNFILLTKFARL